MSAAHMTTDALGFTPDAEAINTTRLDRAMQRITEGCRRSEALLRSLQQQFRYAPGEVDVDQVEAIVSMALEALPLWTSADFDDIDDWGSDLRAKTRTGIMKARLADTALAALATAGRDSATLEELNAAAVQLHDCAALMPDGDGHMRAFVALIEARGLHVLVLQPGPGVLGRPAVHTAESMKLARKAQQQTKNWVRTVHEVEAAKMVSKRGLTATAHRTA